jgi:hypothetical protein
VKKFAAALLPRLPVIAGVTTILLLLAVGTHTKGSLVAAWHMLNVPSLSPSFADTRSVTHSIDCVLAGKDPYVLGTCQPWGQLYNYPAVWLDLRYLGVTSRSTDMLGVSFALMTIISFLLLFKAKRMASAIIVFLAVTSQIILLAVERGNIDEVIFSFLVIGLFSFARLNARARLFLTGCLIVLLTVLKIYPVAAVSIFVNKKKGVLLAAVTAVVSIAALFLINGRNVLKALANTPQVITASFGSYPFFFQIFHHTTHSLAAYFDRHSHPLASGGALILAALSIAAASVYREQLYRFLPPLDFNQPLGSVAVCCLTIFCFAFISGANYYYRLIFLMGPLAYLVEDLNKGTRRSLLAAIVIVAFCDNSFLMRELLDGLAFVGTSAWLGTALLDRMRATDVSTQAQPGIAAAIM